MCESCHEVARWPSGHKDKRGKPVFVKVYSAARADEVLEWEQTLEEQPRNINEED